MIYRYLLVLLTLAFCTVSAADSAEVAAAKVDTYIKELRAKLTAFEQAKEANEGIHRALEKALQKKLKEREQLLQASTDDVRSQESTHTERDPSPPSSTIEQEEDRWLNKDDIQSMREAAKSGQPWVRSTSSVELTSPMTAAATQSTTSAAADGTSVSQGASQAEFDRIWHAIRAIKNMQAELRDAIIEGHTVATTSPPVVSVNAVAGGVSESTRPTSDAEGRVPPDREGDADLDKIVKVGETLEEGKTVDVKGSENWDAVETEQIVIRRPAREGPAKPVSNSWLKEYAAIRAEHGLD